MLWFPAQEEWKRMQQQQQRQQPQYSQHQQMQQQQSWNRGRGGRGRGGYRGGRGGYGRGGGRYGRGGDRGFGGNASQHSSPSSNRGGGNAGNRQQGSRQPEQQSKNFWTENNGEQASLSVFPLMVFNLFFFVYSFLPILSALVTCVALHTLTDTGSCTQISTDTEMEEPSAEEVMWLFEFDQKGDTEKHEKFKKYRKDFRIPVSKKKVSKLSEEKKVRPCFSSLSSFAVLFTETEEDSEEVSERHEDRESQTEETNKKRRDTHTDKQRKVLEREENDKKASPSNAEKEKRKKTTRRGKRQRRKNEEEDETQKTPTGEKRGKDFSAEDYAFWGVTSESVQTALQMAEERGTVPLGESELVGVVKDSGSTGVITTSMGWLRLAMALFPLSTLSRWLWKHNKDRGPRIGTANGTVGIVGVWGGGLHLTDRILLSSRMVVLDTDAIVPPLVGMKFLKAWGVKMDYETL
uniref:Uncharacterized protein n=1 Tax=Chromera velia CCMP2878 TaxID=1169474 RepID=A0A0G4I8Z1_9ALVE|eukprot:Cvel_12094.t1-p1 / transcript=Cvel_12094.t1 / gene=Cvel_12094 / organism=Chromera_velia_CCMP2878 / gene_product=hypothetical protein / transcript_product=hypothetical protein / location=Cvel_scaffold778:65662-67050(+) / protein_length=463 / sequence_SO=supercontig / SO=protein_coding / is_pseudo=false